jgi:hypothetical protein
VADVSLNVRQMVLYHAVPGKIFSKDLQNDITVNSVEGFPIRINIYNVSINTTKKFSRKKNPSELSFAVSTDGQNTVY